MPRMGWKEKNLLGHEETGRNVEIILAGAQAAICE
jgi:hypothetical protein